MNLQKDSEVFFEHNPIEKPTPAKSLLSKAFDAYLDYEDQDFYKHVVWQLSVIIADHLVSIENENVLSDEEIATFFMPDNLHEVLIESEHKFANDLDSARKDKTHFLLLFSGFFSILRKVQN